MFGMPGRVHAYPDASDRTFVEEGAQVSARLGLLFFFDGIFKVNDNDVSAAN
ncbi:hypothetical protein D9M71_777800 [compost metagenome]